MPSGYAQSAYKRWSNVDSGDADTDHITLDYRTAAGSQCTCCEGCSDGRKGLVLKVLVCLTLFFVGLTIGYFIRKGQPDVISVTNDNYALQCYRMREQAKQKINASNIETTLRDFTRKLHQAGTGMADQMADDIKDKWKAYGLENVHQRFYKVLLSYNDQSGEHKNTVTLLDNNNKANLTYTNIDESDSLENSAPTREYLAAFNAYSPKGSVEGEPVFVNYGRKIDLDKLNFNYTGRILIMKDGGAFLGNKVKLAQQYGAIGVLSYPDPHDFALDRRPEMAYPNSWWLPQNNRQWGTVGNLDFGDPLTPDMPAIHEAISKNEDPLQLDHKSGDMYTIKLSDADLPKIPVQGISWGAAYQLMLHMNPNTQPDNTTMRTFSAWRGALPPGDGVYNYGPGYVGVREGWKIRLEVNNQLQMKKIINVIGTIKGEVEPERYIIVGSHHDSWTYGAIDPGSGLSILMELARIFGEMTTHEGSWKPRRSIMFASFDAEKFGRIGSREWVEEYEKELSERAVAFISLDVGITGNSTFKAESDLMLRKLIFDTVKNTSSPFQANETLYETWKRLPSARTNRSVPDIPRMGAGGDFTNFIHRLGIPSLDMTYTSFTSSVHWDRSIYPSYNTAIDTFKYITKFIDPKFEFHTNLTKLYVDVIMQLADNLRLPLVEDDTIEALNEGLNLLIKKKEVLGKLYDKIHAAVRDLTKTSAAFQAEFVYHNDTDHHFLRKCNDRIMKVSRSFICPQGLQSRPHIKNILLGPSAYNAYKSEVFPGVQDAIRSGNDDILVKEVWRLVLAIKDAESALADGFISKHPTFS